MRKSTAFYSWQSDLPNHLNRGFIARALEAAIETLQADVGIELELDADTSGEPGSPDIAMTILGKIKECRVAVFDVSIINAGSSARLTPNPNVLHELGFAREAIGWPRIVMVMNTEYGLPPSLPFDLGWRRVLKYHASGETGEDRSESRRGLAKQLAGAIRPLLVSPSQPPQSTLAIELDYDKKVITGDRHDYDMTVSVVNHGAEVLEDYWVTLNAPKRLFEPPAHNRWHVADDKSPDRAVWKRSRKDGLVDLEPEESIEVPRIPYRITNREFDDDALMSEKVLARVVAPGGIQVRTEKTLADLNWF